MRLFNIVESYNFECEAGPLNNCSDYIILKDCVRNLEKENFQRKVEVGSLVSEKEKYLFALKKIQWDIKNCKNYEMDEDLKTGLINVIDRALEV